MTVQRAARKEAVLKYVLLLNIILSGILTLYAIRAALGTGLLIGSVSFNLSIVAYMIQRNGRILLGLTGAELQHA